MIRSAALVGALVAAGCGSSTPSLGLAVALTLRADTSVSDEALASVRGIAFHASGGETFDGVDPVTSMTRIERVVYRPASDTRALEIEIDALDAAMNIVAFGSTGALALNTGQTDAVTVTLSAKGPPVDDGGSDLTGGDLRDDDLAGTCAGAYCYTFEGEDDSRTLALDGQCKIVENAASAQSGSRYLTCSTAGQPARATGPISTSSSQSMVYFRAFVRVNPSSTAPYANFVGISNPDVTQYMLVGTDASGDLAGNYTAVSGPSDISSNQNSNTMGAWRCVEMLFDRSASPNTLTFYLDDTAVNEVTDQTLPEMFSQVLVGIVKGAQSQQVPLTVDVDNMVIAYTRLGCQ